MLVFNRDHASVVAKASLATGRLHHPLKLVAVAQDYLLFSGWLAAGLRRSGLRLRQMAARRQHDSSTTFADSNYSLREAHDSLSAS